MPCHMEMIDSIYRYEGKKTTTPSGVNLQNSMRRFPKLRITGMSLRCSNCDVTWFWSLPRSIIIGRKDLRVRVIVKDSWTTVLKLSMRGYMSRGDMVPDVTITELKRSKTGLIAMAASRHVKCRTGLGTVAVADSKGSRIRRNPVS